MKRTCMNESNRYKQRDEKYRQVMSPNEGT